MNPLSTIVFALPARLSAKADPDLIGEDEAHFAALGTSLADAIASLSGRLDAARRTPVRTGQPALDRDLEVHRVTARLRLLRRFGLDVCLGRMVPADGAAPRYVGRFGLTDSDGRQLLLDWRTPAAEPFFAATHANPMGLASRRRYRWTDGRITDYWDEVFTADAANSTAALDDQSAFIASLGAARTPRMRDVLATIAADQDAIIRAGASGALVVDGGPGTGKTVVALHRAAYLLHADPRLGHRRGGVLFVGPHRPYLDYVSDVLPSLGEDGVQVCTLRDLPPEGGIAGDEVDPEVVRLKSSADVVRVIDTAVRFSEQPPNSATIVETEWAEVRISPDDWSEAFAVADPGAAHNEAREQVWQEVLALVAAKHPDDAPIDALRRALHRDRRLNAEFNRAWPVLEPTDVVADLWSVPAYLRLAAPWLTGAEVAALQRDAPRAWTGSDLPWLDAARIRVGDPDTDRRARRLEANLAAQRAEMDRVIDHLIAADDSEMMVMTMLRGEDMRNSLEDPTAVAAPDPDRLAGPFAHVIVDEAQELTDAEWQMLLARCPSHSFTVVGDRAQARHGFVESWSDRLERVGLRRITRRELTINYRTPSEVMAQAEPVIRAVLPDANVPTSIRSSGIPVSTRPAAQRDSVLAEWLDENEDGIACVVGDPSFQSTPRILSLPPELTKGLEFDLVVLAGPASDGGDGIEPAVDRYVAMTRSTRQLVLLTKA